jgi:nucleotide-binding universal stress UspA family protein
LFASAAPGSDLQLRAALALADRLGLDLHVLRVVPLRRPSLRLPDRPFLRFVDAAREVSDSCREVFAERFADEALYVLRGDLFETALALAKELDAALLMVPGREVAGSEITALVRSSGMPILVVGSAVTGTSVLAATDLRDMHYPVLRRAAAIGRRLRLRLVALHSVSRGVWMRTARLSRLRAPRRAGVHHTRLRLLRAVHAVATPLAEAVLALDRDPVEAILREARECDACMVVVGTHARSPFRRAVRRSVAARLIDRAQRSILVTPLGTAPG